LRPIHFSVVLQAQWKTPEWEALQRFRLYGAPFEFVQGVVTESVGPPGVVMAQGPGLFFISSLRGDRTRWPDLELRLLNLTRFRGLRGRPALVIGAAVAAAVCIAAGARWRSSGRSGDVR